MKKILYRYVFGAAVAAACLAPAAGIAQSAIAVMIDGAPADLPAPPIERAGRIFVPLRGIFERLGASVVYDSGTINATRGDREISLRIGSLDATVGRTPQIIDVPPFVQDAVTYVPLRFVAQALGAVVNYDESQRAVLIGTAPVTLRPPQPAVPRSPVGLRAESPPSDAVVSAYRPTIAATFSGPVDPNTIRVMLDGLDITPETTRSESGIVYSPPSDLQPIRHEVVIAGRDRDGLRIHLRYSFVSGTSPVRNFVERLEPADAARVGSDFVVRGKTMPGARVRVSAGVVTSGGGYSLGTGSFVEDVRAGDDGEFSTPVAVPRVPDGVIGLTVTSTDPATAATATVRRRLFLR